MRINPLAKGSVINAYSPLEMLSLTPLPLFFLLASALPSPNFRRQAPSTVPAFVTKYAPILHLYSGDPYRPSDIFAQLVHTTPEVNFVPVAGVPQPLTLNNLNALNALGGSSVYLTSKDDVSKSPQPAWLKGVLPDAAGKTEGAVSCAVIVNDHGAGLVDVFYM